MKKLLDRTRNAIDAITSPPPVESLPQLDGPDIPEPDAEVLISIQILNEVLHQNFPFTTTIGPEEKKPIEISVADVKLETDSGNTLLLHVTDAGIQFEKLKFKIGIQSNQVVLKLVFGIKTEEGRSRLVAYGTFSTFKVRYLPKWIETKIVDYIRTKKLSPLLNYDITNLLTLDKMINTNYGTIQLKLTPKAVALQIAPGGIRLKAKYHQN